METNVALPMMLEVAVPLYVMELQALPPNLRARTIQEWAAASEEVLARNGEAILYRIKDKTAESFNALARAIAALSFVPGGVEIFGRHWENQLDATAAPWGTANPFGGLGRTSEPRPGPTWGEAAPPPPVERAGSKRKPKGKR